MTAALLIALQALAANKLRSALTMLGTVIGVTCVVALWNVGQGGRVYMGSAISAIGQNLIVVQAKNDPDDRRRHYGFRLLKLREYEVVREHCPSVESATPVYMCGADALFGGQRKRTTVWGATPELLGIRGWRLAQGSAFGPADVQTSNRVVLLGSAVAQELFGGVEPVGQKVRLNQVLFYVAGVLAAKGTLFGDNQDDCVLIPYTAGVDHLGWDRDFPVIWASSRTRELIPQAKNEIRLALRQAQQLDARYAEAFEIQDLGEMSAAVDQVLMGASLLLGAIGGISLMVGGIGIMNIMLVSVTERTKEIGLRMALGATDFKILGQFLVEAAVLSSTGGLIGIAVGVGVTAAAGQVLSHISGVNWPLVLDPTSLLVAFVFSVGLGIFFGFYPAWRASRLDPIEALRHE